MKRIPVADMLSAPRAVSRRHWLERLPTITAGRARLRPDFPRAVSGQMRSESAIVPPDISSFVASTSSRKPFLEYCVWAAGLCFLLYRLDTARTVIFASPARRADNRGGSIFVHSIEDVGRQTFRQLLESCRTRLLQDYDHGAGSLLTLPADLALLPEGHDLFDVVLMSRRLHGPPDLHGQDVNLLIDPDNDTLVCQFRAARYAEGTWRARIGQLWEAMRACRSEPDSMLCRLDVLGPLQRERILVEWNETAQPIPDLCVDQLIERQAERSRDAMAVHDTNGQSGLSYAELTTAGDRLARCLRSVGVRAESRVGIFGTRRPQLLVAVLGTWKAG
ncbi:MAG: AMP-binding protein, partial [Pseudonocardiaceae bacterium]